jgi:hypothetical protein
VNVTVLDPDPGEGREDGEKLAVNPVGNLVALKVTALLNPPATVVVAVTVPVEPAATLKVGDARLKLRVGLAVSFQCCTNRNASGDPSPDASSYPGPAENPVVPGTELFPLVTS